jgi:hypothetical protein
MIIEKEKPGQFVNFEFTAHEPTDDFSIKNHY